MGNKTLIMMNKIFILGVVIICQANLLFSQNDLIIKTDGIYEHAKINKFDTISKILQSCDFENLLLLDTNIIIEIASLNLSANQSPYYAKKIARNIVNDSLAKDLFDYYCLMPKYILNKKHKKNYRWVDYELLDILKSQNIKIFIDTLKSHFSYWENTSLNIKKQYPSGFVRFWQYIFSGMPYTVEQYQSCKFNSLKIAIILNKLGVSEFSDDIIMKLRNEQIGTHYQNYVFKDLRKSEFKSFDSKNINLDKSCSDISQILNDTSFIYTKILNYRIPNEHFCYNYRIYKGNKGLLNIGCQWAPLSGRGEIYLITLISDSEIKIEKIGGWIS